MTTDIQFEATVSEPQPGLCLLAVSGEIDVATAPEFQMSLSDLVARRSDVIVVDMSDVSFIDSTGLGVLVGAETDVRRLGKSLRLVVTQPQIMKLLELTGLDEVFTIVPNTRDAVRT